MTVIRSAKSVIFYWAAIFISGVCSFFGKPGPAWASEAKQERNAKVFNELYRVAQTQPGVVKTTKDSTGVRAMFPETANPGVRAMFPETAQPGVRAMFPETANVGIRAMFPETAVGLRGMFGPEAATQLNHDSFYQKSQGYIESINAKLRSNQPLTFEEMTFYKAVETDVMIGEMGNRIKELEDVLRVNNLLKD